MRTRILAVLALAVLGLVPSFARAQSTSTLTGIVTDQSGALVPGASIKVIDTRTGTPYFGKTAGDGSYRIDSLPPGPGYALTVTKDGFQTFILNNLYLP